MKKIFLVIALGLSAWTTLPAQCLCDFQLELVQDPADPCCFDVFFCNNGGPTCNFALTYSPLIISTNGNPNATAPIASATSANTSIVTATLQGSYQAVFSSNFAALGIGCNPKFNLGRICLANAPNAQVQFSATINQPGGPCALPIAASQFMVPTVCSIPAVLLEKIYGDAADNRPTAIKAFGDGLYVSGYRTVNGVDYGTFMKFDLTTGALFFERELTTPGRIVDFEYDAANDEFLLVGWTTPLSSTVNNRSILLKIDDAGNWVFSKFYDQPGREAFTRIVQHPSPLNPAYPYYILGRKNPAASAPSSDDVVVLYNIGASGARNWSVEYAYSSNPTDDEFFLGLFPNGGDLIVTGLITNNDGALLVIDGANGSVLNSVRYPQSMDIHDGITLWDNRIALVGENFAVNEAFVMVVNPLDPNPFSTAPGTMASLQFPNIFNFKDIWVDQYGKLYVIGENKNPMLGKNYQVVHKLNYFAHGGASQLSVDWAKYLEDLLYTELSYANGVISVTPNHNRIFYADARLKNTPFFGSWDMLVGSYDLDLNSPCNFTFPYPTTPLLLTTSPINVSSTNFNEPPFVNPQVQMLKGCCTNFCSASPCTADFTWVLGDCFAATFTATSSSCFQGTYTYEWDFNGDGIIDATTNNPVINHTFPCGGGIFQVCVTVTDPFGCVATICKPVNVNNCVNCFKINGSLMCNPNDFDAFNFTITVQDMTPASSCSYSLINLPPGWVLSNFAQSGFPITTLTGTIHVPCTTPTALNLTVQATCTCPQGGSFTCPLPVSISTMCCKSIQVPFPIACETDKTLDVPIQAFGTLCNITQVSWFVLPMPANGICPTNYWGGLPYQQTTIPNVLEPLHLFPANMSGDVCVYAEVLLNDGPCTKLVSNIASVQLCAPTTCTLMNDQNYCFTGPCITPAPLTLQLNSPPNACFPTIQWCDPDDNVVQHGGTSYTPTQCLSMANPLADCYEDFFYTVKITDFCGTRECKARIRLYSDDAPKGTLEVLPFEANTLCPYEDATLHFTPGCDSFDLADPPTWDWYTRPCDPALGGGTLLSNAGTMNPNWNTNILLTSAYYYVETKNGVCPADTVQVLLEVKDPLTITAFSAASDPCAEQQVMLNVSWAPCTVAGCPPGTPCSPCSYTVDWYKDCMYIGTTNEPPGSTSSSFVYATLPLAGNYYAVVKDDCCPNNTDTSLVATIDPACFPVIEGPCFRCENETVMLTATAVIPPTMTCPHACTFSWSTTNGVIVGPANVPTITVNAAGTYTVTISCIINGGICTKTASYTLIQCQRAVSGGPDCGVVSVEELLPPEVSPVRVFPNPTSGGVTVEWKASAPKNAQLLLTDATGRIVFRQQVPDAADRLSTNIDALQPGLYFIKIQAADRLYEVAKVVKL